MSSEAKIMILDSKFQLPANAGPQAATWAKRLLNGASFYG